MTEKAKILSSVDIQSLFAILETTRNRALFAIGIYTGMRISEILELTQAAVFTDDGDIRVGVTVKGVKRKNTQLREIPLHFSLREELREYKRTLPAGIWLFPGESPLNHLSRTQAHNILAAAFRKLCQHGAKTNSMRRTFLVALSSSGVPLTTIQAISGHANLAQLRDCVGGASVRPEDKYKAILRLAY